MIRLPLLLPTAVLLLAAALSACGGDDDGGGGTSDPDNVLSNGGFEDGATGWTARAGPAIVSDSEANAGSSSLLIDFSLTEDSPPSGAEFAYQEAAPGEVPEFLSFDYNVADWIRGTDLQYIEAVLVVTGSGPGMPECPVGGEPCPNIQIRYVLGGIIAEPAEIRNARWRFVGEQEPPTGEWLHFEADVRNHMTEDWGSLPSNVDSIRLQFEVRYDDKNPDELDAAATVYWDNVYLGPR